MKNMKKILLSWLMLLVMLTTTIPAYADDIPYDTYNYDYWGDVFRTPAAYVPQGSVLGTDLTWNGASLGAFVEPQDLCVASDGSIWVADTNNHRIVVLDSTMTSVLNVLTGFDNAGLQDQFNKPTGIAVTEDAIYIADSMNRRIVVLEMDGALRHIVEIPAAASTQKNGTVNYTVGTYVEGMDAAAKVVTLDGGDMWAAVNLGVGSPLTVTDADGLTFTVTAEADALAPFSATAEADGATLTVGENGASVVYTDKDGNALTISQYNPVPNPDLFMLIGRLVKLMKNTAPVSYTKLSGVKGVWIDEDGDLYAGGEKNIVKLDSDGELLYNFTSYKDMAESQVSLTSITEFGVAGDLLYIRDHDNRVTVTDEDGVVLDDNDDHIVVMNEDGDVEEIIFNNAIRITAADGSEVATLRGYDGHDFDTILGVDVVGDLLLVGQHNGVVAILTKDGSFVTEVENDSVLRLNADGELQESLISVQNGKTTERFSGLTGVALADGKLCVVGADNRVLVVEDGAAVQIAQNNAVLVTDGQGNVTATVTGYEKDGEWNAFAAVNGVEGVALNYVCDGTKKTNQRVQRQLVISDSKDQQIVLDAELNVTRVCDDPDSEVLDDGYLFTPLKVSVDYAGRIYCVAQNMFEGIMVFETNGEFTGFFGTIEVTISAWDKFWRKLATKEERSKQQLFIPTEFTGIDIDEEGFVYASNVDTNGTQAVRRLNPKGEDVIRKGPQANLGGDLSINGTSTYAGASKIVDVVYREKGMYSLLDSKRGRIFTYDHEGNLLYVFGGLGSQEGTVTTPVAIEYAGDRILALDSKQASILVYGETEYGRLINEAVGLRYDGDESQAVALWEEVLRLDENNELANVGIGKAYLSAGDNEKAMEYLKRGMSQDYYSVAFKRYRNEILKENIQWILTGAVVLIAAAWIFFKVVKPKIKAKREGRA